MVSTILYKWELSVLCFFGFQMAACGLQGDHQTNREPPTQPIALGSNNYWGCSNVFPPLMKLPEDFQDSTFTFL